MALPTIDATVGGPSSNSFVTLSEAESFFELQIDVGAWETATDDNKKRALLLAAKAISRLPLVGRRNVPSQALAFPRAYPYSSGIESNSASLIAVPQEIKDAQCLEAEHLLRGTGTGRDERSALQSAGVKAFTVGNYSETFSDSAQMADLGVSAPVARLLLRWLRQTADLNGDNMIPVVNFSRWDD